MNVSDFIKKHASTTPEKTAILFKDQRITYRELEDLINRAASGLSGLGLSRGDVISIFLPSLPELVIAYMGAVRAGFIVNLVNAMLRETEIAYILNDCASKAVITDASRRPIVKAVENDLASPAMIIPLEKQDGDDAVSLHGMLENPAREFKAAGTKGSDVCHLMYTSGTTGWPKGVMATHLNILHNAREFGKVHFSPEDTIMVATPIFHCWGLVNGTFGMLSRGGSVITVERFYPGPALDEIEKRKPSVFIGVPPMYNLMLKEQEAEKRDLSSVVFCLSAATKMPENLIRQIQEAFQWRYAEAWGLTEVSCVGATSPYTETRMGSCGRGMDDAVMKVVDENGDTLPPGEQGELCVKGTCVTNGYLNKPDVTREVFDDEGWFHSGDIAYMDEDGFAYIVDRKKDMINVGGEKVFPSEVEDMMLGHPKIKDLVIVGIHDELRGEAPKAFVQLKDGETASPEEIREYCKSRMAPYKIPVAVEFIEEIPRLASGKALRRQLREREARA